MAHSCSTGTIVMSVIQLSDVRASREQPDPEHIRRDQYGRPMQRYALSYEMGGKDWSTEVWAYSFEDAENRVAAMARTLVVQGQMWAFRRWALYKDTEINEFIDEQTTFFLQGIKGNGGTA